MEVEKRKRFADEGEVEGKKVKAKGNDENHRIGEGITAAVEVKGCVDRRNDDDDDDGKVEEFFAILRRIHVAVKYFEKGKGRNGSGKKKNLTAGTAMPWSPSFERADFEGGKGKGVKGKEIVGDNVGLDLNVEPDPDSE